MLYLLIIVVVSCLLGLLPGRIAVRLDPEARMNTTQLIRYQGYLCEEYTISTSDGYLLQIQRIPRGRLSNTTGGRSPVLLWHGLLSCSACWVENLANNSLGFILADAGFDVWLGNSRGNSYGLKHVTLNTSQPEFWAFSFDEMALLDLPDTVRFILGVTGASKLQYVGHSQGTEIAFAALSRDPDLNDLIGMFAALGPAAYLAHVKSPVKLLEDLSEDEVHKWFGYNDFLPRSDLLPIICEDSMASTCEDVLFLLCGPDSGNTNKSRIPVYIGQHPAGTSVQNMIHYVQAVKTGRFQMFDFGTEGNIKKYNQTMPPAYNVSQIRTPVALYGGGNDWLTTPTDVARLRSELPGLPPLLQIPNYNHLDYIWAMDAPKLLYPDVIKRISDGDK
ncbi:lysosomal acid lipase/cholesteryl ester hydrolase-like isoform X5 [Dreissena polymorpha]|uniref:lysosomal acid lipase/cholesteryl ester hydrolase-like isoform X5 n=1 Tax=Dreissena polymorpha TaxID=45954 RepID=UPI002264A06A|nr:lysosomal acid lipase/cholesteryl ester hydrolase-like isoform X5 [Dreissena polymorpha]